ncbi:MAG: glycine zipper 2TM domain-containing protein [Steroidobacteraceae bacterium]
MTRTSTIRFVPIVAALALGALGGTAQADPQDGGWSRGRDDHANERRWDDSANRGDRGGRREQDRRDDRWSRHDRDDRDGHERRQWRSEDAPRYGYGYGGYPYGYGYRNYGYRGYGRGNAYPGYGYRNYEYGRYRRDDGRDDDAALTIAGGVIGGLIGNHAASPENRAAGTVFGALVGGVLGHAIGQSNNDDHPRRGWRGERDGWGDARRYRHDD